MSYCHLTTAERQRPRGQEAPRRGKCSKRTEGWAPGSTEDLVSLPGQRVHTSALRTRPWAGDGPIHTQCLD